MRALASACTLTVISALYLGVGLVNAAAASDMLPSFAVVAAVLIVTHLIYARRERDPHG